MADRKVTSRLNMANAFKEVCDTNTDVVALVPAFVLLVTGLGTRITALRAQMKKLSMKTGGLAENKAYWKEQLSLLLSVVCGAGISYARKINDMVLENKFGFPISTFIDMRDTELIETAQSIIDLQTTVAAQLVDYGITAGFMDDVDEALDNFEEANPKPIVNVYTSEADRALLLKMAFSLSDYVLQDMMKAALIFKVLNPIFYQSLDNASLIRNAGLRHEEDPETAAAKELKKEAQAKEKAAVEAAKLQELTEKKDVQEPPNAQELLKDMTDTMNTNGEDATTETPETSAVQQPSLNGH